MNKMELMPYPGLRPFERNESLIFFGRAQQVDELLLRLKTNHFLAVLGASGSGKSSLVKAGLLPGLAKGYMGDEVGTRWSIAEMRPGDEPFTHLAQGLLQDNVFHQSWSGAEAAFLAAELRRGARSLHEILNQSPLPQGTRLLILVDQFEELFRYRDQKENQTAAFVALLLEACGHPDVYIVITMRSDFLGNASEFYGLPEAINNGLYLTPRLTREQLHDAICLPAQLFGGAVDETLANHLLNESGNAPDQLPLLQHALMRLWEDDNDKHLTLEEFRELNGLRGALDGHAEQAWHELNAEDQIVAEALFRALTERNSREGQVIRRPSKIQDLLDTTGADLPTLTRVVEGFRQSGRNFLMPPPPTLLQPDITLDISHESLIRQWSRLQHWVTAEDEKAEMYQRLNDAAQRYAKDEAELWQGTDLAMALKWREEQKPNNNWAKRYGGDYVLVDKFLQASKAKEQKQLAEKEVRQIAEMKRLKKQYFFALGGFMIAIGLSLWAINERNHAENMTQKAKETEQKATRGLFDSTVTHASLLTQIEDYFEALEKLDGIGHQYDNEVEASRRHARDLLAGFIDIIGGKAQATFTDRDDQPLPQLVGNVAISPDGRWLAASGEGGTIALFERASRNLVQKLEAHDEAVRDIVFHPAQPWLFSAGYDGQIIHWQLPEANQPARVLRQWHGDAEKAHALAMHPDGAVLASGHSDGAIRLWKINSAKHPDTSIGENDEPKPMRVLDGHKEMIASRGLVFSPDGQLLASASYDNTVGVWEWQDTEAMRLILKGHNHNVLGVTFSPNGKWLASSSSDQNIILWQRNEKSWQRIKTFKGHQNLVFGLQYINDALLASASSDDTIRLWDVHTGTTQRILQGHTARATGLALWREDGRTLLYSASNDGTVKQWAEDLPGQWLVDLMKEPKSNAIDPNGNMIAVGFDNGDLRFYTLHHEISTPALLHQIEDAHTLGIVRIAFNDDGSLLATASMDGAVTVWSVHFNAESQKLTLSRNQTFDDDHDNIVHSVAFSPDGSRLATASFDGRIGLFSLVDKNKQFLEGHKEGGISVNFDKSGKQLLSAGDFSIKLWDLDTEPPVAQTIATAKDSILWSSFSSNGTLIATVGREQVVKIDSVENQNQSLRLYGHESTVYKAIFSPDNRQLATVSADMTVRLWDLDTQSELFRLRLPDDWTATPGRPSPLWDFDFRCTPTGCWIAVPLTSGKLALYNLGKVNYESTH